MPKAAPAPSPAYEPGTTYNVRLKKVVTLGRLRLLPRNTHEILGAALNQIVADEGPEVVDAADPIA